MSDRELLEMAAKATSVDFVYQDDGLHWIKEGPFGSLWNPLTEDGDAFRLAVELEVDVHILREMQKVIVVCAKYRVSVREPYGDDRQAATRRAIVRAAAAIGAAKGD